MGLTDPYLAFCFDEACDFISSMEKEEIVKENGKQYIKKVWIKEPNWIDKPKKKINNNSELIKIMQENLKRR